MRQKSQPIVVAEARKVHAEIWKESPHVSSQTKAAQQICRDWQQTVLAHFGERFRREYPVASLDIGYEKIDLVDMHEGIAFELKVSPKNTHFEFYRDIFKLAVHNKNSDFKLSRLVFITPEKGVAKLKSSFVKSVSAIAKTQLGFDVELEGI